MATGLNSQNIFNLSHIAIHHTIHCIYHTNKLTTPILHIGGRSCGKALACATGAYRRSRNSGDSCSRTLAKKTPMVSPLRTVVCRRWPVPSQYEYVIFSGSFFSSCAGSQEHSFSHMHRTTLLSRVKDVESRKDTLRCNPAEQSPGLAWQFKETRLHGQQVVEGKAAFQPAVRR